jgi:hypothetical protein
LGAVSGRAGLHTCASLPWTDRVVSAEAEEPSVRDGVAETKQDTAVST